jgi:hypothetical protein
MSIPARAAPSPTAGSDTGRRPLAPQARPAQLKHDQGPATTSARAVPFLGFARAVSVRKGPLLETSWHCYLCVRQEMVDQVNADHEYLGLVMINGTSYCLWHARRHARRALSLPPIRSIPAKLAGRQKYGNNTGQGSQ